MAARSRSGCLLQRNLPPEGQRPRTALLTTHVARGLHWLQEDIWERGDVYQGEVHAYALVSPHVVAEQAAVCAEPLHIAGEVCRFESVWAVASC